MGVKLSRVDIDVYYLLCWVAVSVALNSSAGGARKEGLDDLDDGWYNTGRIIALFSRARIVGNGPMYFLVAWQYCL